MSTLEKLVPATSAAPFSVVRHAITDAHEAFHARCARPTAARDPHTPPSNHHPPTGRRSAGAQQRLHASAPDAISPERRGRSAASHHHVHTTYNANLRDTDLKTQPARLLDVADCRPTPPSQPTRSWPGRPPRRRRPRDFFASSSRALTRRFLPCGAPPLRPLPPPLRASPIPTSPFFASDRSIVEPRALASSGVVGGLACGTSAGIMWMAADAQEPACAVEGATRRR